MRLLQKISFFREKKIENATSYRTFLYLCAIILNSIQVMAKKVVIFLRVSTTQQDLEAQREKVVAAAIGDGWKKSEMVFVEGKESAIKNDEEHRVTLNQLKEEIARHPIEAVYVFAIDRLARKVSIVLSIKDYLTERKINLTFLHPHRMSTLTRNDEGEIVVDELTSMLLLFLGYGAEMEMKVKQARFAGAKELMKTQGKITNGSPLFGYSLDDDSYPVENDDADTVREIFSMMCSGVSCAGIYNKLMKDGKLKPVKSYSTRVSFIHRIINKKGYSGDEIYPPIVTEEVQERAKKALSDGKSQPKTIHRNTYLAKSIIWWEDKGKMCGRTGQRKVYRYDENRGEEGNKSHCISISVIDGLLWMFAKHHYVISVARSSKERTADLKFRMKENELKIEKLKGLIEDCEKRLDKAFNKYVMGNVPDSTYEATVGQIKGLMEDYSKQVASLETEKGIMQRSLESVFSGIELNSTFADLDALGDEKKVEIIREVVDRVVVTREEKTYKITYRTKVGDEEVYYYLPTYDGSKNVWYFARNGQKREVVIFSRT